MDYKWFLWWCSCCCCCCYFSNLALLILVLIKNISGEKKMTQFFFSSGFLCSACACACGKFTLDYVIPEINWKMKKINDTANVLFYYNFFALLCFLLLNLALLFFWWGVGWNCWVKQTVRTKDKKKEEKRDL